MRGGVENIERGGGPTEPGNSAHCHTTIKRRRLGNRIGKKGIEEGGRSGT